MGKKIELTIPVSQLKFQEDYVLFKWEKTPLLLPREDFPIHFPTEVWEKLEYFKTALPGQLHLALTFPWFKAGIEFSEIHLTPSDVQNFKDKVAAITDFIHTIQTAINKKELNVETVQALLKTGNLHLDNVSLNRFLSQIIDNIPPSHVMEPLLIPLSTLQYNDNGIQFTFNGTLLEIPNQNLIFTATTYGELIKKFLTGDLTVEFHKQRIVKWNSNLGKLETIDAPLRISGNTLPRMSMMDYQTAIQNIVKIEKLIKTEAEKNTLTRELAIRIFNENGFTGDFSRFNPIIAHFVNQIPPQESTVSHTVLPAQLIPRPGGALFKYRSTYFMIYDTQLKLELYHFPPEFVQFINGSICAMIKIRRYIHWDTAKEKLNVDRIVLEVESVSMSLPEFNAFQRQKMMIAAIAQELDLLIEKNCLTLDKAAELFKNLEYELSLVLLNRFLKRYIDEGPQVVSTEVHTIPLSELEYRPDTVIFKYQDQPYPIASQSFPFELGPILEEMKPQLPGSIEIFFLHFHHRCWDGVKGEVLVEETAQNLGRWEIPNDTIQAFLTFRQSSINTAIKKMCADGSVSMEKVEELLLAWGLNAFHQPIANSIIADVPPWESQTVSRVFFKDISYGMNEITVTVSTGRSWRIPTTNLTIKSAPSLDHIKQVFKGFMDVIEINPHRFFWDAMMGKLVISTGPISLQLAMDEETRALFKKMTAIFVELCNTLGTDAAINHVTAPWFDFDNLKAIPYSKKQLEEKGYDPLYVNELIAMAEQVFPTQEDLWFKIKNCLVWERPVHGAATYVFQWPAQPLEQFMGSIWGYPTLNQIVSSRATTGYQGRVIHSSQFEWKRHLATILARVKS